MMMMRLATATPRKNNAVAKAAVAGNRNSSQQRRYRRRHPNPSAKRSQQQRTPAAAAAALVRTTSLVSMSMMMSMMMLLLLLPPASFFFVEAAATIDAETGRECVDADPVQCPVRAAAGECETNRNAMRARCKKSCNRCHVVRVSDPSDINRFLKQKKTEYQEKRKQYQQEKEAMRVLQGGDLVPVATSASTAASTGGGGDATNKATATATATAKDATTTTTTTTAASKKPETNTNTNPQILPDSTDTGDETPIPLSGTAAVGSIPDNKPHPKQAATRTSTTTTTTTTTTTKPTRAAAATGQNKKNTNTKTNTKNNNNQKQKQKKKPKIDAQTGLECVDTDRNCAYWASAGECSANRTWMHANCKLSCDRCHVVRVQSHDDINRFLAAKTKAKTKDIEKLRKSREARRVLAGGSFGASGFMQQGEL